MNPDRHFSFSRPDCLTVRRNAVAVFFILCLLWLTANGARAAEDRVTFDGSIVPVPVAAGAKTDAVTHAVTNVAGLSAAQLAAPLEFSVALGMRNLTEFQARVGNGELVPYEEVQARYMPLQADYDRVVAWLKSQGFTLTFNDTSRLSVFARGTVAQIQSTFGVTMQSVTVDGVAYTSAINAPSLPASVTGGVLGINGLQPHLRKHTHHRTATTKAAAQTSGGARPDSLTTANQPPYLVSEVLNAYNGSTLTTTVNGTTTTLTGSGQKIAIVIDALAAHTDLTTFWSNNKIAQSINNIEEVMVGTGTADATEGEETLDEEWSSGIAPGAKVRVYDSLTLDDANLNKCLAQIQADVTGSTAASIAQPQLHAMSMSYGEDQANSKYLTYSEYTTEASYYVTIANGNTFYGGVTIFASSGDAGSQQDETSSAAYIVSYPAADASITGVGGTDLTYSSTAVNGRNWTEKGWGEYSSFTISGEGSYSGFGGSGGGAAGNFYQTTNTIARPAWQAGTGVPSGSTRLVPDVASVGGPTVADFEYQGTDQFVFGTSWSSPSWAGYSALINQARALNGRLPLGQLNRRVYPLIGTANFYDITAGNNSYTSSKVNGTMGTGNYSCTTGYDEVTGVGTPNLTNLVAALTGPTITNFSPASGATGTSVVITGTNFYTSAANPLTVIFNGTAATAVTVNSATQITVTVPSGATTGPVAVTSIGDTATSTTNFTVNGTTTPAPTITGFTPTSGTAGTSVTITGTNLTGATAVSFNGTAATTYTVNSATQITATVPTGATSGTISVTTAGGTAMSTGSFTVTTSGGGTGSHVVISQVYGGGGSSGGTYLNDYVELYNPTSGAVDLSSYSVQYTSATGSGSYQVTSLSGTIAAGHYYLVKESAGTSNGGTALPTADATGTIAMSSSAGRVGLVSNTTAITGKTSTGVVDFVGYGSTATDYEGSGPAPTLTVTTADLRAGSGATDTDNNSADFTAGTPNPRNSATAVSTGTPDLTVTLGHGGNFTQADKADTYTITVGNGGTAATSGTVSVVDTLPSGLTATGLSGTGWTAAANFLSATRTDALAAGGSYPALTLTVKVSSTAASSVTNSVTVSGGGETNTANDTATDPTTITALTPSQSWRYQYFGTTDNSGNAADTANPSGDGLPNLIKYALGLDPTVPTVNPITVDVSTGYLRLTTPKNANATDVTVTVQVSGDLTNPSSWTTTGTTVDQNTSTMLQVQDSTPVNSAAERFLRLTVTR